MNAIQNLEQLGQSIWYDNISRGMITSGELRAHIAEGLLGMTSNPTIFDKAISGSTDYDEQIRELVERSPKISAGEVIQALMVRDLQMATDTFRPVFDRTKGLDGYVSVEVTPSKARDTKATIEEVRLLWKKIDRKNLMVKIPATKEGLPAIEQATSEGMNINVTLIFSLERYREVAEAYIRGLERRLKDGKPVDHIRSVASVFVSRIDTLVDDQLKAKIASADKDGAAKLQRLFGKSANANTVIVYQAFREIFESPRFAALAKNGACLQRPLWGSTGTKNPAYSDLLYVEPLVGRHTVNTVPPSTYAAILDHLKPTLTIESDVQGAKRTLEELKQAGIDMRAVTDKLEADGVAAFEKSFDGLYRNLEKKQREFASAGVPTE